MIILIKTGNVVEVLLSMASMTLYGIIEKSKGKIGTIGCMHRTTIKVNGEWDRQAVIRCNIKVSA